jgi:RNA polymerase sigma-70 factor, ECF subfamily
MREHGRVAAGAMREKVPMREKPPMRDTPMADPGAEASAGFDELYRASSRRILQYAYAMTGDLPTAQDITQEAFIRAWRQWRQVETYEHAEAWLRVVVTRLVTDRWRRLRTSRRFTASQGRVETAPPPSEDNVVLVAALRRLPVQQRRAVCLHHLLDLPISQIAVESGVSENTVKSWLVRGRAALADILGPDASPTATRTTTSDGTEPGRTPRGKGTASRREGRSRRADSPGRRTTVGPMAAPARSTVDSPAADPPDADRRVSDRTGVDEVPNGGAGPAGLVSRIALPRIPRATGSRRPSLHAVPAAPPLPEPAPRTGPRMIPLPRQAAPTRVVTAVSPSVSPTAPLPQPASVPQPAATAQSVATAPPTPAPSAALATSSAPTTSSASATSSGPAPVAPTAVPSAAAVSIDAGPQPTAAHTVPPRSDPAAAPRPAALHAEPVPATPTGRKTPHGQL